MDADRFDALTRSLTSPETSRRRLLTGLAGSALGALAVALGVADAGATHTGCRHPGKPCVRNGQCCSGRCSSRGVCLCPSGTTRVGGRCELIGGSCPAGANTCTIVDVRCGTSGGNCACYEDRALTSRCLDGANFVCVNCRRNSDCEASTGVGSACIPLIGDCATACATATACVGPCAGATSASVTPEPGLGMGS